MEVINYDCVQRFYGDYLDPYPPRGQQPESAQPMTRRLLDPAVSLPTELTSCIFEKYVEFMSAPFSCPSKGPWHYPRDAYRVVLPCWIPLRLGAVCQRWRQIAWATPSLWTELLVDVRAQKFNRVMVELVRQWIDRSGSLPMRVRLFKSGYHEYNNAAYWSRNNCFPDFMNMVNELAPRWRSIDFDNVPIELTSKLCDASCTEEQSSILNSITLGGYSFDPLDRDMVARVDTFFTQSRRFHQPTHVSLLHPTSLKLTNVNIDWGRVAHLHFDRLTYRHFEHTAKLPALQFLSVFIPTGGRYPWLAHPGALHPVIELRSLISFSLRTVYDQPAGVVFAHLNLPNLRHLEYAHFERHEDRRPFTFDNNIASELVALIHRSGRKIQDLTVRTQFFSDMAWISLLELLPPLRKLAVGMSELNETAGFLDKLVEYQCGPWNFSLGWLEVTACAPEWWTSFFQLLEGTSQPLSSSFVEVPSPARAPQITLTVIGGRDYNSPSSDISPYMDESELHRLVQLWKNHGIFCQFGDDSYLKEAYFDIDGHKIFGDDTDEDLELLRTMSALKF